MAQAQAQARATTASSKALSGPSVDVVRAERWGAALAGGSLAIFGLSRRSAPGLALAAAGGGLVYQAFLRSSRSPEPEQGAIAVERAVTVNRSRDELYRYWRDFTNLPRFMDHLLEVTTSNDRSSHWVAKAPLGTKIEWDAEISEERPNELIAWRSREGSDVPNQGSVAFTEAPIGRGTEVKVNLAYQPPAGPIGTALAKLFGEEPDQQVREDLRRFKAVMEAGEVPSTDGQPSGRDT